MAAELEVRVVSTDDKVRCAAVAGSNPEVNFDYVPPIGRGKGYTGLEGILMSFAACSGTTLVSLLRKMNVTVVGFKVNAKGIKRKQPPISLETISLEFEIVSPDAGEAAMKTALELTESVCPVWNIVRNNVEITTFHRVVAPPGVAKPEMTVAEV